MCNNLRPALKNINTGAFTIFFPRLAFCRLYVFNQCIDILLFQLVSHWLTNLP